MLKDQAKAFLDLHKIAIVGLSSKTDEYNPGNGNYDKLKELGYQVFAVNPNMDNYEGNPCYPDLKSIPEKPEGAIIFTPPVVTKKIMQDCADLGIKNVWIHKAVDGGSYFEGAEQFAEKNGIDLIPGGCPLMFVNKADFFHKCMRPVLQWMHKIPD